MNDLSQLLESNRRWAERIRREDPDFFPKLSKQQAPKYLWIGCSDSRMPANQIADMLPGQIFVHRNVANLVLQTDLNCLSVMQYAVDVLKVKHIIVCGHHGCGGVQAALQNLRLGLIDEWLSNVQDVQSKHERLVAAAGAEDRQWDRLCELNVIEQVRHVCMTTIVRSAWTRGQELSVHGLVYSLQDGILRDLEVWIEREDQIRAACSKALARYGS